MSGLKDLRTAIGLSQAQMADYLSVSRSQLAAIESNRREPNTEAGLRMADLAIFLDKPVQAKITRRPKEKEQLAETKKMLARHANELDYKIRRAQRQLEAMQLAYQQHVQRVHFIKYLTTTKTHAKTKPHPSWLDLMEIEALEQIEKNGLHLQTMLELSISSLEGELAIVKGKLQNK